MAVTQNISLTGVKNDLVAIAQAERMYYTQNGATRTWDTLSSKGRMNITRTNRDGTPIPRSPRTVDLRSPPATPLLR